jgi:CHAD domain-containing protein
MHRGGRYPEITVEHTPERELKLAADRSFRMPSIFGLGGATVRSAPPERNDTTYYDTDDLRLARWGASLRHRPGEGWTVKLPAERDAPFLVRPEIVFEGNGGAPPEAAVELVRGFVRSGELDARIRMTTIRQRRELHGSGGELIGGVVDDAVSVRSGEHAPTRFRELEVEIGDEMTPSLLDALVERLRQAGAGSHDHTAKYIRALGDRPLVPEISVADLAGDATAGDVVRRAIGLSVIRLVLHDPVVRLDVDAEGVHQARVATRRLRSDLRTFRTLVEPAFAARLRDELGWLAAILGRVRDGDVLLERLRGRCAELPAGEQAGAAALLRALESDRDAAHARLLETLRSTRYVALLDELVEAANAPALLPVAATPATETIPALVRRPWHRLAKRVDRLGRNPSNEDLHDVRIRAKRARYAAEAAAAVVGKPARTFARAAAGLQEVLGDLNDAVVAAAWLDGWSKDAREPTERRAAQALVGVERSDAARLRAGWRVAWEKLADPQLRAWM